tara:strand:+ start:330 stop:578 length:249 start_codon:yes stop_codon:yes gene_type:complete
MVTIQQREVKYGSREYWFSYAEDIIRRTKINRPWFSEIKCAEIGLRIAVEEGDPKAIKLSNLLAQKKIKNDFNIYKNEVSDS